MGREWVLRKEMIRALILIELKHIDLAEKILNAIKQKNNDLFSSKQYMLVSPYITALEKYINEPENTDVSQLKEVEKVFDFIEQKEGYVNPTRADEETEKAMKPGVIYLGELGFGFVRKGLNNTEVPYFFPFPISQRHMEEDGYEALKQGRYITDIKDGGIFVWNDALEAQYKYFEEGGRFVGDEIV